MNKALFIDLNTTDIRYVEKALCDAELSGTVIIKKAYGYVGNDAYIKNSLYSMGFEITETPYKYRKRTSAELLTDMTVLSESTNIEEIYFVTGDAYSAPVIRYALGKGKRITVAGTAKAASACIPVCSRFRYLEVMAGEKCDGPFTDISDVRECAAFVLNKGKTEGRTVTAFEVLDVLCKRFHEFDIANYGYTHFETFISSVMDGVFLETENGRLIVKTVDNRQDVESFIVSFLAERDNKTEDMDLIFEALRDRFPDFSIHNYGYGTDIGFILSFPKLEIYNNKGVKLRQTFKLK